MTVQTSHSLTLLSDSSEAHMTLWRLRAALPECAVSVKGREVVIATGDGVGSLVPLERVLRSIPHARTHLAW